MTNTSSPRFDEPNFTIEPTYIFDGLRVGELPGMGPQPAMPNLAEAQCSSVAVASEEPLVRLRHRNIRVLSNYWHGGWDHAIPDCWIRAQVLERLGVVTEALPRGWGLAVFDAWRPIELQQELYDAAIADPAVEPGFMAPIDHDPAVPPPHLTGAAVDLTLTYQGTPLAMGTGFDDVTKRANTGALEDEPGIARELRRCLFWAMRAQDFVVYCGEWWHFEYGTRRWAAVTGNEPFYAAARPA